MKHDFSEPTREAGLKILERFVERAGADYARDRNHDNGPDERANVSGLSPFLRRRLVLEEEVVGAALKRHGARAAEKFVQEVVWRTYWKGWLQMRPSIWHEHRAELEKSVNDLNRFRDLRARYDEAVEGRTGIEPFDEWSRELRETGYLHNHARMWFASIWLFTLELPLALGADFFHRHLLDGDPASNTLSWRWVAGLHTAGKAYAATASNIAKFTNGRFRLKNSDLNANVRPIGEAEKPDPTPLPTLPERPDGPFVLLVTEDDCCPETLGLDMSVCRAAVAFDTTRMRSPLETSDLVKGFAEGAMGDALARVRRTGVAETVLTADPERLKGVALAHDGATLAGAELPVGPARDVLEPVLGELDWRPVRRRWDALFWPHATAGYFKVKKKIPDVLRTFEREA